VALLAVEVGFQQRLVLELHRVIEPLDVSSGFLRRAIAQVFQVTISTRT
jgi:hypothetical protein